MIPHLPQLLGSAVCAAVLAYACTWLARLAAPRIGYVDKPDGGRKRHGKVTPLLGGVAVYVAFAGTLALFFALGFQDWQQDKPTDLALLVGSGGIFCLLGLWDDKWPLRARDKFLLQILASLPFAIWGPQINTIQVVGFHIELGPWALPFYIFWLVSCANVVNLVDGLDGLASSVGLIAVGTMAALSLGGGRDMVAFAALAFAGSIAGFLIHNWPPAKIFLGDAGSLTIGFMVGAIAIESSHKTTAGFMLVLPLALLSVPILDTSMAILRRKLTGRGIGEADRGHIHHRLQDRGLSKLQTLLAIVGICTTMAGACLLAITFEQDLIAVVLCVGVIATIIAGRIFGFHELMLVFRHIGIINASLASAVGDMTIRRMVIHLEHAESYSPDKLWETVQSHVADVGGMSLEMRCTSDHDGQELLQRRWSAANNGVRDLGTWQLQCRFPRRDGLNTTFLVSGRQLQGATEPSLDQMMLILEACGRNLPSVAELLEFKDQISLHPLRRPTPAKGNSPGISERRRAA